MENKQTKQSTAPRGPMGMGMMGGGGEKAKNAKGSLKKLASSLKVHYPLLIVSLIFAIIGTVLSILTPEIIQQIADEIIIATSMSAKINMDKILTISLTIVAMISLSFVLSYFQGFIMSTINAKVSKKFRRDIMAKMSKLPLSYFDKTSKGDVLSRITNDVDTIGQSLNQSLTQIVSALVTVVGVIVMMFINSVSLSLIALVATPISFVFVILLVKNSQKFFRQQQKSLGEINGIVEESFSGHTVVKTFNYADDIQEKFENVNKTLVKSTILSNFISNIMFPVMNFMNNVAYVAICIVGGIISIDDPIFVTTLVVFVSYMRMFNQQLGNLAQVSSVVQSTAAASERVFEFLEEVEQADESDKEKSIVDVKGNVEFKDVCFGYEKGKTIVKNFSAKVKKGEKVAIVGPTGAGKTTLVNLLMRFYDIDSGDILIDNVSTFDLKRENVRTMFSMVLQDSWIFDGTVYENITFGSENKTREQVEEACRLAHIDHYIKSLPGGYDMKIDEDANISSGQRQLLTIARAMISDKPMLILDEATSSVDTRTEEIIQKAMDSLTEGRTSFVIAHRLSTIKNADQILVMKDGNIIEQGNHKKLLKQNGFYAELYNSQFSNN